MPNSVKYFDSTMSGAPSLSGTAGALIGVLDACLVDGFGSVTVDSLVVASNVVTATVSAGHQFAMVGNTGPVIRIAGASPSGLNGDWRVTVTSSTVFTFATSGIGDQTATGTITAKRAPAGFSKAFSGTNKAAYRSDDITGTRLFCRIDDGYTTYSRIRGYEAMSEDVDTGTGLFPTDEQLSGGGYVYKSNAASSVARDWTLFSDGRAIYLFCDYGAINNWNGGFYFGDVASYVAGDMFGCGLISSISTSGVSQIFLFSSESGSWLARSYRQISTSIGSSRHSHDRTTHLGYISTVAQAYPALADNSLHLWPVECWDANSSARGMMPGLWNPIHDATVPNQLIVSDIPQLPNRDILVQHINGPSYKCAIDLTGPWR